MLDAGDSVPQKHRLMSLTVEPTFLGSVAAHTRTTTDVAMRGLVARAGSVDGTFRFVQVAGHRVLERMGPHGKQIVIPPEGGLRELVLQEVHAAGHFGVKRTLQLLA